MPPENRVFGRNSKIGAHVILRKVFFWGLVNAVFHLRLPGKIFGFWSMGVPSAITSYVWKYLDQQAALRRNKFVDRSASCCIFLVLVERFRRIECRNSRNLCFVLLGFREVGERNRIWLRRVGCLFALQKIKSNVHKICYIKKISKNSHHSLKAQQLAQNYTTLWP